MRENYNIHARPRPDSWLVCCPLRCHHEWCHEWQHGGLWATDQSAIRTWACMNIVIFTHNLGNSPMEQPSHYQVLADMSADIWPHRFWSDFINLNPVQLYKFTTSRHFMHKKTTEFCTSFCIQENVSRLHISMNHIAAVNELESGAHLTADARYLRLGQWPFQLMHNAINRTSDTVLQINLPAHTNVYWRPGFIWYPAFIRHFTVCAHNRYHIPTSLSDMDS